MKGLLEIPNVMIAAALCQSFSAVSAAFTPLKARTAGRARAIVSIGRTVDDRDPPGQTRKRNSFKPAGLLALTEDGE